jgi:surface polysaccharide O-acyltransferase-like enzyme
MQEKRDSSFDGFRGLAIIAVVAIHTIYIAGSPESLGFICYRQFLNFAVPAFFFMSGYWAAKEEIVSFKGYRAFVTRRLLRIAVPYLFWSGVLLGYSAVESRSIDLYKVLYKLLTGSACMGYYFIIALGQLYVLTGLLQYINRKLGWYGLAGVLVFNLASMFALYLSRFFGVILHLPAALLFYSWIIYYQLGLFMSGRDGELPAAAKVRSCILPGILISWFISAIEATVILSYGRPDFAVFGTKYSSLLYSIGVILGFLSARGIFSRLPGLLHKIGRYSFGIYLIHVMVLGQVVRFFQEIGVVPSFQPLYQLTLVVLTTLICFVIITICRKLLPVSFCSKVLGF